MKTVWRLIDGQRILSTIKCKFPIFDPIRNPANNAAKIRCIPFLKYKNTCQKSIPNHNKPIWRKLPLNQHIPCQNSDQIPMPTKQLYQWKRLTKYGSSVSNPRTTSAKFPSKLIKTRSETPIQIPKINTNEKLLFWLMNRSRKGGRKKELD